MHEWQHDAGWRCHVILFDNTPTRRSFDRSAHRPHSLIQEHNPAVEHIITSHSGGCVCRPTCDIWYPHNPENETSYTKHGRRLILPMMMEKRDASVCHPTPKLLTSEPFMQFFSMAMTSSWNATSSTVLGRLKKSSDIFCRAIGECLVLCRNKASIYYGWWYP